MARTAPSVFVLALLAPSFLLAAAPDGEPCGARGDAGESYACVSLEERCRGSASGAYWRVGNTTAHAHACTGAQPQLDGATCVGEGTVYRANATRFGHACRGFAVYSNATPARVGCVGDSWGEGIRANATGRVCPRPVPPSDPATFIYDLLGLVSYSAFAAFMQPFLKNPLD